MTVHPAVETDLIHSIDRDIALLERDGVAGRKRGFPVEWADRLRDDMMAAFWEAIQRPGGAVGRGPRRWYVEIHPEALAGFVDLVTHPWITGMAERMLGEDYQIVEIGFDMPVQGARNQPWHRDFPSTAETYKDHRITSLAFNLTGVDVTPDMGPFEVAPGTQWDDGLDWKGGMFPDPALWPRFEARAVRKYPQRGDISCRSALTVHRGTTHVSPISRPVLVLGVDAPGAGHSAFHDMMVTQRFHDALPESVHKHLVCRVVDELIPITQKHDIEGLLMAAD